MILRMCLQYMKKCATKGHSITLLKMCITGVKMCSRNILAPMKRKLSLILEHLEFQLLF